MMKHMADGMQVFFCPVAVRVKYLFTKRAFGNAVFNRQPQGWLADLQARRNGSGGSFHILKMIGQDKDIALGRIPEKMQGGEIGGLLCA